MTFDEWMLTQSKRNDAVGLISRDFIIKRKNRPDISFEQCYPDKYLGIISIKAIRLAKKEFENATDKIS